jgi:hypothetical protein
VFAGRVFIVAGSGSKLGNVADALVTAQALVAVIGPIPVTTEVAAHFHADPANEDVWERVVPHVEQRLGPIDGVVTDEAAHAIGERMVGADFDRRGHGAVIAVDESGDVERVLRLLVDTR